MAVHYMLYNRVFLFAHTSFLSELFCFEIVSLFLLLWLEIFNCS